MRRITYTSCGGLLPEGTTDVGVQRFVNPPLEISFCSIRVLNLIILVSGLDDLDGTLIEAATPVQDPLARL